MVPSLEGWPTKAKEAPSPHEVRLTLLDNNPVLQYLGDVLLILHHLSHPFTVYHCVILLICSIRIGTLKI